MIYGGRSGEHEVSLASAAAVFKNLDPARYEAIPIKIEKDGRWSLPDRPPAIDKAADVIHETQTPQLESDHRRETHLVARPGGDTLVTLDSSTRAVEPARSGQVAVSGVRLDVVFPAGSK